MKMLEHRYGDRVTILDSPSLHAVLARLGEKRTGAASAAILVREVYAALMVEAVDRHIATREVEVETRMAELTPAGVWRGAVPDPATRVAIACVLRAGLVPAQACLERFNGILPPDNVRLDTLLMARITDDEGHVTGVDLSGSKIGGPVDGRVLLIPDPMGATGGTINDTVRHYREHHGTPDQVLVLTMISTPEFLRSVLDGVPDAVIVTGRLDRGLSSSEVLACVPGECWDDEVGLTDTSYIVPGAGGVGEVLTNSWV